MMKPQRPSEAPSSEDSQVFFLLSCVKKNNKVQNMHFMKERGEAAATVTNSRFAEDIAIC